MQSYRLRLVCLAYTQPSGSLQLPIICQSNLGRPRHKHLRNKGWAYGPDPESYYLFPADTITASSASAYGGGGGIRTLVLLSFQSLSTTTVVFIN